MGTFSSYFCVFLSNLMQSLLGVFCRIFMRYYSPRATNKACSSTISPESHQIDSNFSEPKQESKAGYSKSFEYTDLKCERFDSGFNSFSHSNGSQPQSEPQRPCSKTLNGTDNVGVEEEKASNFVFKFQYQTCKYRKEFNGRYSESYDFSNRDTASASTNRYEFILPPSFSNFIEDPEVLNLTVKELYFRSNDGPLEKKDIKNSGFLSESELVPENSEAKAVYAEIPDISTERIDKQEMTEKLKAAPAAEQPDSGKDQVKNTNNNTLVVEISAADNFVSEDVFIGLSSESNSISSNIDFLFESQSNRSTGDGFLSDTDFGTTIGLHKQGNDDKENAGYLTKEDFDLEEENNSEILDVGYEPDDFDEEDRDTMEERQKLEEECQLQNSNMVDMEKISRNNFHDSINSKPEESDNQEKRSIDCSDESAKPNSQKPTVLDLENSNRFDTLWEHQDLVEQMKMELKKVRATGLPTILEDYEFPRIIEDLKPWKIDEKFQHGSVINELPKFYRSYRERMRKFDILNYQKMCAIGFVQSKDPQQSSSRCKTSAPAIVSLISHRFGLCRRKKTELNPMKNFIKELYSDLEIVYVGQLCLSWELLQWEYEKASELWESDQYGLRRYDEVAGEFQQFQVLLLRFMENEPFQGPRVENYVKNRCVMRNLLQVPLIREDKAKDEGRWRKRRDNDAMTCDMLVEILEESIRTIWRFIKADKDASSLTPKGIRETQVETQEDSELLEEVRADLHKKEKRVREVLRSGSCILKKLQKHEEEEDGRDQALCFFSQVDIKLMWRVLHMKKITKDQLAWCRNKLNNISFINGRIHVDPSFLLFPCS